MSDCSWNTTPIGVHASEYLKTRATVIEVAFQGLLETGGNLGLFVEYCYRKCE